MSEMRLVGIYCWDPTGLSRKKIDTVTASDLQQGLANHALPPKRLLSEERLREMLPTRFLKMPSQKVPNDFPYSGGCAASELMARRLLGVQRFADFLLGGSVLGFFATRKKKRPEIRYVAQRHPWSGAIVVGKVHRYVQNFSQRGFQFERLVTGQAMAGQHDRRHFEAVSKGRLDGFDVVASAEVDAVDDEGPVEVEIGNDKLQFGTKQVWQMISGGARSILRARRLGEEVVEVTRMSFQEVVDEVGREKLQEANHWIARALRQLAMADIGQDPMTIDFDSDGTLRLERCPGCGLLPPKVDFSSL